MRVGEMRVGDIRVGEMSLNHIWQALSKHPPFLSFISGDVSRKVWP